MFPKEPRLP